MFFKILGVVIVYEIIKGKNEILDVFDKARAMFKNEDKDD